MLRVDGQCTVLIRVIVSLTDCTYLVSSASSDLWVIKTGTGHKPWRESALQRYLHKRDPKHIVPLAFDSDRIEMRLRSTAKWRPVKVTQYIENEVSRRRQQRSSTNRRSVDSATIKRIRTLLRGYQSDVDNTIDCDDDDWACERKNVLWRRDTCLFHDFDQNV